MKKLKEARGNVEELYNLLSKMSEKLKDVVTDATELVQASSQYGGELARVLAEQMNQYFIPYITKIVNDETVPGDLSGIVHFLDSVPLAMIRQNPIPDIGGQIEMPQAQPPLSNPSGATESPVENPTMEAPRNASFNTFEPPVEEAPVAEPTQTAEAPFEEPSLNVVESVENKEGESLEEACDDCCPTCGKNPCECKKEEACDEECAEGEECVCEDGECHCEKCEESVEKESKADDAVKVHTVYRVVRKSEMASSLGETLAHLNDNVISEFDTEEEANERAELLNGTVLPEEAELFGTRYEVEPFEQPVVIDGGVKEEKEDK